MLLHAVEDGVLHVTLPCDVDVTTRAAATLEAQALIYAHRPRLVRVQLDGPDPSPASLSTLARARRACERLGIPLTVVGPLVADAGARASHAST